MRKENIVDLTTYRDQQGADTTLPTHQITISADLEEAIENLIHQLREVGPIQQSG